MIQKKTCDNCFFWGREPTGSAIGCNYILMTGRSRVAMGAVSEPGQACVCWLPRDDKASGKIRHRMAIARLHYRHRHNSVYLSEEQLAEMRREMQKDFEGDGGNE